MQSCAEVGALAHDDFAGGGFAGVDLAAEGCFGDVLD